MEKERELQRRRTGQDLKAFKQQQEELELKQLKEERKKAKIEEAATRQKILDQIKADRANNAAKFSRPISNATAPSPAPVQVAAPKFVSNAETARVQFKKPDGTTDTHTFSSSDTFAALRAHVVNNVLSGSGQQIGNFILAKSFPRRKFTDDDNDSTLLELDLAPTSVVLILPIEKSNAAERSGNGGVESTPMAVVKGTFWSILGPILVFFSYLKGLISRRRGNVNDGAGSGGVAASAADIGRQKRENEDKMSDNDA